MRQVEITARIREIHEESRGTYGYGRVHAQLRNEGVAINKKTVARFMKAVDLRGRSARKYKTRTTVSDPNLRHYPPNLAAREFTPPGPNQLWVTDTTFLPTRDGWCYLAVVLDCWSRKVVGYSMGPQNTTRLCLRALDMALHDRLPAPGLVHHSDRGSTYSSREYQGRLQEVGALASMSRTGDCYDNAVAESFFGTMKTEIATRLWASRRDAEADVFSFIEGFYNTRRLHSSLDYHSPSEYEATNWPSGEVTPLPQ